MKTNKMKLKTTAEVCIIIHDKLISDTAKWHRNELTIAAHNQPTNERNGLFFRWVEQEKENTQRDKYTKWKYRGKWIEERFICVPIWWENCIYQYLIHLWFDSFTSQRFVYFSVITRRSQKVYAVNCESTNYYAVSLVCSRCQREKWIVNSTHMWRVCLCVCERCASERTKRCSYTFRSCM